MNHIQEFGLPLQTNQTPIETKGINSTTGSKDHQSEFSQPYHLARLIETYAVPSICSIGIIANTLAVKTFLNKRLRNFSCSRYLITKCICDTIFLFNLFGIYIGNCFSYDLNTAIKVCKIGIFITYVSGFLSVWTVICVTVENFIRIRLPFQVKRFCSTRNANISIFLLVFLSVCIYNFSLWISDKHCSPIPEYSTITQAFIYIDTGLTLIIPSILLTFLIVAILVKLLKPQRKPLYSKASRHLVNSNATSKSKAKVAVVTRMLLSVSLTFFLLTVTSHIVRIKLLVSAFVNGKLEMSVTEAAVQRIAQLVYYLSMAVNFFIFIAFGGNFRKVFKMTFLGGDHDIMTMSKSGTDQRSETLRLGTAKCEQNELVTRENETATSCLDIHATSL